MEESSEELRTGRISFSTQHPLTCKNGILETMGSYKALEHLDKEKSYSSSCYHPLEIPKGPYHAMEFLSRSWSPSASDFFHIFPSNNLLLPLQDNGKEDDHNERLEIEAAERISTQGNKDTVKRVERIWTWLAVERPLSWFLQRQRSIKNSWGGWLGCREKKKEEVRLRTAKIHAALSVARLAAAVAGFTADGSFEPLDINHLSSKGGAWNKKMDMVVASAAALVATVCAEAAESAGAHRAHIASAINSGLATRTSADMMTLTATAATCLRGAAALKSRATADTCFSREKEMIARGTQLSVCTSSGRTQFRLVCIYIKNNKLILRLGKKCLGGFLTTSKECKISSPL
ncbi:PREDICTED: VAN3-binding protein-like [Nelumbo nucifera]|uniref:VAN3-binding protein-like n=1 Tax=Nelumbo nucifera TaxID=4432 RepID=A0A1U8Q9S5_NELNU|nr:PREDICTED: VAN3-binding protein-like [Nelumbo nucifera]